MSSSQEQRRPRADAQRNRQRIVEAASTAFSEDGLDVSVAEIATRAGVGTGTLFRNFPSKDDLIRAILEDHLECWIDEIKQGLELHDAEQAFHKFFDSAVSFTMRDRAIAEARRCGMLDEGELGALKSEALALVERLLVRVKQAGHLREDLSHNDVFMIAAGVAESANVAAADGLAGADEARVRYVGVALAGMRP